MNMRNEPLVIIGAVISAILLVADLLTGTLTFPEFWTNVSPLITTVIGRQVVWSPASTGKTLKETIKGESA